MKIDNVILYDSPGFVLNNYFYNEDEFALIKRCSPKPPMDPTTYQLKTSASILIEDRIRLISSIDNNMTLYIGNNIILDKIYEKNNRLLDKEKVELDISENSDLIIKGLGFINIRKSCKLSIYCLKNDIFEVRKSVFS